MQDRHQGRAIDRGVLEPWKLPECHEQFALVDASYPPQVAVHVVTLSLADPAVRRREVDALTEALDEQRLDVGLVLTESEREDIVVGKRVLKVRPLTGWLCGLDG